MTVSAVSGTELYDQVWREPMTKVAIQYNVSSSYLARVCTALDIPRPERGYWAKLEHGHKVKRPPLPDAPAGIPTEWEPGAGLPEHRPKERVKLAVLRPRSAWTPRPSRHPIIAGIEGEFLRTHLSRVGYLRPYRRKLPDLYISKDLLPRALDAASELFLQIEDARCPVGFAPNEHLLRRMDLDHRLVQSEKSFWNQDTWAPSSPTIVMVNDIAFGLTVYEPAERVEAESGKDFRTYVRVKAPKKRRYPGEYVHEEEMPSGQLAVRAYCAHSYGEWQQTWHAETPEGLPDLAKKIVRALKLAAPDLAKQIQERTEIEEREAEQRRLEWEEYQRREAEEARIAAEKAEAQRQRRAIRRSRRTLISIVDAWAFARQVEDFFMDAERRANGLDADSREQFRRRLERARELLGNLDTLERFRNWNAPEER